MKILSFSTGLAMHSAAALTLLNSSGQYLFNALSNDFDNIRVHPCPRVGFSDQFPARQPCA